jgi:hypothetical protein
MLKPATTPLRTRLKKLSIRPRTVSSAIALTAVGAACALVVSACGSSSAAPSSTTSSTTTPTSTTATTSGSFTAYQNCLKKHGVNFAGGGFGGPGRGASGATGPPRGTTGAGARPTFTAAQQKALATCASLRPSGATAGRGGFGAGGANANNPAFAKFQACLKKHGVQTSSTTRQTSTTSQAALAACRSLLPSGGGGFGPGSGSSASGGGANSATFAKYQTCLKQHGVQTGASGQSAAKLQTAIAACRSLLPNNGTSGTTAGTTATGG